MAEALGRGPRGIEQGEQALERCVVTTGSGEAASERGLKVEAIPIQRGGAGQGLDRTVMLAGARRVQSGADEGAKLGLVVLVLARLVGQFEQLGDVAHRIRAASRGPIEQQVDDRRPAATAS